VNHTYIKVAVIVLALFILLIDALVPLGVACGVLYTSVVLVAQFKHDARYLRWVALACSVLTIIGFFLSPQAESIPWMVYANRTLSIYVIWLATFMAIRINRLHAEEVKTLSGLLPICSWCKNVRNDQGYWTKIESYIKHHTDIDLSHSICPPCMEKQLRDDGLLDTHAELTTPTPAPDRVQ
jgi:hypothetical protein